MVNDKCKECGERVMIYDRNDQPHKICQCCCPCPDMRKDEEGVYVCSDCGRESYSEEA
jgi:hypothetical protein